MRTSVITLLVLAFTLAGCTGDGDGQTDTPTTGSTNTGTPDTSTSSSPSPTPTRQPQTHDVRIEDFAFHPSELGGMSVRVGDTVRWTNHDSATHTVDSKEDGPLDSEGLAMGESYEFTFDAIGRYDYQCDRHPSMTGYVQVYVE